MIGTHIILWKKEGDYNMYFVKYHFMSDGYDYAIVQVADFMKELREESPGDTFDTIAWYLEERSDIGY